MTKPEMLSICSRVCKLAIGGYYADAVNECVRDARGQTLEPIDAAKVAVAASEHLSRRGKTRIVASFTQALMDA